jgi:predicted Rossmann fold nucleotide-binding protein DprA/Smf involved in DNA uptake
MPRPYRHWRQRKLQQIDEEYRLSADLRESLTTDRVVSSLMTTVPTKLRVLANKHRVSPPEVAAHLQTAKAQGRVVVVDGGWVRT